MWTHDNWCSKLTGCTVDNQRSIPSWETNGTVGFNRAGDVTVAPRTIIYRVD